MDHKQRINMKFCFKLQKRAKETRNVKISLWLCCSDHEDGLQVVLAIS